ncbi:MAG: hypothetical protein QW587_04890 [Candidatus Bathyarchaeia archaeon]
MEPLCFLCGRPIWEERDAVKVRYPWQIGEYRVHRRCLEEYRKNCPFGLE